MIRTLKGVAVALALLLPNVAHAEPDAPKVIQPGNQLVCNEEGAVLAVAAAVKEFGMEGVVPAMQAAGCVFVRIPGVLPYNEAEYLFNVELEGRIWSLWSIRVKAGETTFWFLYRKAVGPAPARFRI